MSRLIDADELKVEVKKALLFVGDFMAQASVEDAINQAPTVNQWHYPSKGEYPTDHTAKTRIVANNFGVTSAIYDWTENRWYDNYNRHIPIDNVYAWCELPEPPKEEA